MVAVEVETGDGEYSSASVRIYSIFVVISEFRAVYLSFIIRLLLNSMQCES